MKIRIPVALLLFLMLNVACAQDKLTNTRFESVKLENGKALKYVIHLPEDYDGSKAYPTIIGPGHGTKKDSPAIIGKVHLPNTDGLLEVIRTITG